MRWRSPQSVRCAVLVLFGVGCLVVALKNVWEQSQARRLEYEKLARLRQLRGIAPTRRNDTNIPEGQQTCQHPYLLAGDEDMLALTWTAPTIICTMRTDWVEVQGSKAQITTVAQNQFGPIECYFTAIMRTDDDLATYDGETTRTTSSYFFVESDFARVRCSAPDNETWDGFVAGIRFDTAIRNRPGWDEVPAHALRLDVLAVGFHSMSRPMFQRTMPRTFKYLVETLGGVSMQGYNTVEEGKAAALVTLLTGRDELELPEARRDQPGRVTDVDGFPFLWNDFQQAGYVTAYLEDSPHLSVFSDRLSGFKAQPTDHYLRPFYLAASKNYSEHHDFCLGSVPRHKLTLRYMSSFFNVYKEHPKFLFAYLEELNGNNSYHLMGSADEDMVEWLTEMKLAGHLDHTMVVFLSDHGQSFPEELSTLQSKLEERLPFLAFSFPRWFAVAHSWKHDNMRTNALRLTTPYDVHATLVAVLGDAGVGNERGVALFRQVPSERTCEDAFVPPRWCACLAWGEVDPESGDVEAVTSALLNEINRRTIRHRDLCTPLRLQQLEWFRTLRPHPELLPRRKTPVRRLLDASPGNGTATPTSKRAVSPWRQFCRLRVCTKPGGVCFEALVDYRMVDKDLNVVTAVISRVDQLGQSGRCVPRSATRALKEVCVCQDYVRHKILRDSGL